MKAVCGLLATIGLAACGQTELPPGAYGRAVDYEWACERYQGLQAADEAFARGGVEAYKRVLSVLMDSGSCISFSKGDPIFFGGERQQGYVKVGRSESAIKYFAPSKILPSVR